MYYGVMLTEMSEKEKELEMNECGAVSELPRLILDVAQPYTQAAFMTGDYEEAVSTLKEYRTSFPDCKYELARIQIIHLIP
jgi:hypothetical protein